MNKKGQVTLFIILAIVILVGVLGFFLFKNKSEMSENAFNVDAVKMQVDDCIEQVGNEVILRVASGGGYYLPPKNSLDNGIPIYLDSKGEAIPTKEDIEKEINYFTSRKLFFCTRNFIDFPNFNISQEKILVDSQILDDKVILDVYYPITIRKGDKIVRLENFDGFDFNFDLGKIYNIVSLFLKSTDMSEGICFSCLVNLIGDNDFSVRMMDYNNYTIFSFVEDEDELRYYFSVENKNE